MYKTKRVISSLLAVATVGTLLTGCGSSVTSEAMNAKLSTPLTQQEVLDYYADSMKYDTIISREAKPDFTNYELKEVTSSSKKELVTNAFSATDKLLRKDNYKQTDKTKDSLTDSMYNYIRADLNNLKLKAANIEKISQALGYYFVDVDYTIDNCQIGTFKPTVSLIGISGGFKKNLVTNKDLVDSAFVKTAVNKLNEYFKENGIDATASFDAASKKFVIAGLDDESTGLGQNDSLSAVADLENKTDAVGKSSAVDDITADVTGEQVKQEVANEKTNKYAYKARTTGVNLDVFDKVVGYGSNKAYIPDLSLVYNIPAQNGGINGIGLYPSGGLGLTSFGSETGMITGKCKLRFVYKEDLESPSKLILTNIYTMYSEIDNGYSDNEDSMIPQFLSDEFSKLLERADRAMIDNDIAGLARGSIFDDIGMAVLNGYKQNYGNVNRQISTIRRIISRNIDKNAYLVEIESYTEQGAKSSDLYAAYKDTIYAVIQQKGSGFVFTDWLPVKRELVTEPDINPDAATEKRVVALGLTGDVSDKTKAEIKELVDSLYASSTKKLLSGPKTYEDGTTLELGMYDCFDSNIEMLSSTKKEKINATLRNILMKYNSNEEMTGTITQWIGGTENQAEFITEELVRYQGHEDATYMTCYYLVSAMEDKWVIDDLQILSQESISGEKLQSAIDRINK